MSKGISIAGRKVFDGADFYRTPEWATEALLAREDFLGWTWEPACGDGSMSKVLIDHGLRVFSSDLYDRGYDPKHTKVCDFLQQDLSVNNIITNPPFNLAQEFVQKALDLTDNKVAMLLKLQFLEGAKRQEWFKTIPLKTVYVFSKRVTMYPAGEEKPKNSGTTCFAWYVFDHKYTGKPQIEWI